MQLRGLPCPTEVPCAAGGSAVSSPSDALSCVLMCVSAGRSRTPSLCAALHLSPATSRLRRTASGPAISSCSRRVRPPCLLFLVWVAWQDCTRLQLGGQLHHVPAGCDLLGVFSCLLRGLRGKIAHDCKRLATSSCRSGDAALLGLLPTQPVLLLLNIPCRRLGAAGQPCGSGDARLCGLPAGGAGAVDAQCLPRHGGPGQPGEWEFVTGMLVSCCLQASGQALQASGQALWPAVSCEPERWIWPAWWVVPSIPGGLPSCVLERCALHWPVAPRCTLRWVWRCV